MAVFFPLLQYFIMALIMIYWVTIAALMMSTGNYTQVAGVYSMEWDETMQQAAAYHFFGLLWTMSFLRHLTIITLAGSFGTWYWTSIPDKDAGKFSELHPTPVYSSLCRSVVYHWGTVAFGSFIIAVLQFIQYVLEYLKQKADSDLLYYVITCVQCLVECFERCMEFLSKMAYIVTACKGNMFCTAAFAAFHFLLKHMGQTAVVGYITTFLMILGKGFVLGGTIGICFVIAGTDSNISSPYMLLVVCAIIAYLVACLFLGVVDAAIDTIMVCFCWEQDANGQMEDAAGNKMVYGTKDLIQYIDGAKALAQNLEGGATVAPAPVEVDVPAEAAATASS